MSSNILPANPTAQTVMGLLPKFTDPDPDYRFMAVNDLLGMLNIAKKEFLVHDYNTASRTVDLLIKTIDDSNGEVQNQALKCLGPLVKKLPAQNYGPMMEKLATLKLENAVDASVPALALKAVVEALPRPDPGVTPHPTVREAYHTVNRVLIPRLLSRPANGSVVSLLGDQALGPETVDVLIELVSCFGSMLGTVEVEALQDSAMSLLERDGGSFLVKKRAVVAVSMLARHLSDELLENFINRTIKNLENPALSLATRPLFHAVFGSMAREVPSRISGHIPRIVHYLLQVLGLNSSQADEHIGADLDSVYNFKETALYALEGFLEKCPDDMRRYTNECIQACLHYIKFDPNSAVDDEDEEMDVDEDEEGFADDDEEEDEFEADAGFDDDDDASWKVRRRAARTLHVIISTRSNGDLLESGVLYRQVAPALVKQFAEREENVRLEILSAMSLLIRKTGEGLPKDVSVESVNEHQMVPSRKRRRQSSANGAQLDAMVTGVASPTWNIPTAGPRADLAVLTPSLVKAGTKLLKGKFIPTKQAVINLLDDIVNVQRGGLGAYFDQILGPVIDAIKTTSGASTSTSLAAAGGNVSATVNTLRIAALRLVSDIAKKHSSKALQPHLDGVVRGVAAVIHDRYYKISSEAMQTAEELVKLVTLPRSRPPQDALLPKLYEIIMDRVTANDADVEVREKAIHALGTFLSRTNDNDNWLKAKDKRQYALWYLVDRLKNETTRLAAVRAIDIICLTASRQFDPEWTRAVVVELADQLKKANRDLRGASVVALKHLVLSSASAGSLDALSIQSIVTAMISPITNNDSQLLGPGLLVLAQVTEEQPNLMTSEIVTVALCSLLQSSVAGTVLDSLLAFITKVGQTGQARPLMLALLKDVGVGGGDTTVVGKVIGTLLIAGGESVGVSLNSFVQEIQATNDQARVSLAFAVLGEAGLRLGKDFRFPPSLFMGQFTNDYDKVSLAAAVALGRAAAGNTDDYLPDILRSLQTAGNTQYLLLQSIKEVLQTIDASHSDIVSKFFPVIWDRILAAVDAEDNKAVCAECVGSMVITDPHTYMPKLDSLLRNSSPTLRAIAVQALRYTLPFQNDVYDTILKGYLVDMMKTILQDGEMEIRRHAMSTLTSACHNLPELILDHLGQLMPFVMAEAVLKPELVREVQMGPFKHIIDDGLEVRKAAYETLYALLETAFSRINITDLHDRIIAGLADEHDIRALCILMITKLIPYNLEETNRRLDAMGEAFRAILSTKLKDTAVKQEYEKQQEAHKSVCAVTNLLGERASGTSGWRTYYEWVKRTYVPTP